MLIARLAVLLLLGSTLGAAVFYHPTFAVSSVEVTGLERLTREPLLERVSLEGHNILTLPIEHAIAQLQEDPWVRAAHLKRQLPSTVLLAVEERTPAAVWQVSARFFTVDLDGTILEEVGAALSPLAGESRSSILSPLAGESRSSILSPLAGESRSSILSPLAGESQRGGYLPVIKDMDGALPKPGDRVDAGAIAAAVRLTELLPYALGEAARSFEYLSYGGLVVETDKGRRARIGDASDLLWKLAVWKAVLVEAEAKKLIAGHIDLRFGDRPFFRDR